MTEKFDSFVQNLKRYYVFDIKYKNTSKFMSVLGKVLFFNKDFMSRYITTIGNTVYFPSKEQIEKHEPSSMATLAHELVHVSQKEKYGMFLFSSLYLFPQCLAILSVLAILAIWWLPFLWCLLFLLFLAPIPAPWRKKFELEGYTMTLFMHNLRLKQYGYPEDDTLKELTLYATRIDISQFRGSGYWYMWPFGVDKNFVNKIDDIQSGVISDTDEIYGRIERSYLEAVSTHEL